MYRLVFKGLKNESNYLGKYVTLNLVLLASWMHDLEGLIVVTH